MSDIQSLGGNTYQLNIDISKRENLDKVYEAGKSDGLDQVYVHDPKTNQSYVIQGDGLDLSKAMKQGRLASTTIPINGEDVRVNIMGVDNELNTAGEGFGSLVSNIGKVGGLGVAGTAFGTAALSGLVSSKNIWVSLNFIEMQGVAQKVIPAALLTGAALVVGSTAYGALRPSDEDSLNAFIKQSAGVRTN